MVAVVAERGDGRVDLDGGPCGGGELSTGWGREGGVEERAEGCGGAGSVDGGVDDHGCGCGSGAGWGGR